MATEVFEYTPEQERKIDTLVDTGVLTYDDARRRIGIKAVHPGLDISSPNFSTPGDHKPANTKAAMRPQYGDNGSIENPEGEPHYFKPYEPLSQEQQEINKRGSDLARETLRRVREQREGKTSE